MQHCSTGITSGLGLDRASANAAAAAAAAAGGAGPQQPPPPYVAPKDVPTESIDDAADLLMQLQV
jgi:hypothetical protein